MNRNIVQDNIEKTRPGFWHLALLLCGVVIFRYLCHSIMLLPVLWNELRTAPHLPDILMDSIPQNMTLLKYNYWMWLDLLNPFSSLFGNSAHLYLTQDMFFSGHIATTFLVFLYARTSGRRAGGIALLLHLFTLAVVLLPHLHYTVDIVGAYAITFSIYTILDSRFKKARWLSRFALC